MSLWSNTDANTSAPKNVVTGGLGVHSTGSELFDTADTSTGQTLAVFGVDAGEQSAAAVKGAHAGWVLRKTGTGGRAGRVHVETLVAMGSMSGDAEDVAYPDYAILISGQPTAASNVSGGSVTFSVTAATRPAGGTLSYQWYVDEDGAGSGAAIDGETAATLSLSDIATDNVYYAVVSVTGGNDVTSANAALTITA